MATETKTFYPGAYDTSDYKYNSISGEENPVGKGADNATSVTIRGVYSEVWTYWPFDVSLIPVDAEINSVSCAVKAQRTGGTSGTATIQLYSGDTPKGEPTTMTTTATIHSLSTGIWTRDELMTVRLRVYAKVSMSYSVYFYGADLAVTYTYQGEKFMLKLSGAYEDVARTFKKVSGVWVEVDDLSTAVDTSKKLVNGGEITS